jgi:hypothetical protein
VLTDSTANKHVGMVLPGATFQSADAGHPGFGGFLHLDGNDGSIDPQLASEVDVRGFPAPNGSWSVAGWVRAPAGDTGNGYATIISTELLRNYGWQLNLRLAPASQTNPLNQESAYQYAYWVGPGDSQYRYIECACFVADGWVHVAGVADFDRQLISIYHDGVLVGSQDAPEPIKPGSMILYFGRWGSASDRRLVGDLDDFVVYDRALTQPEIKQLASGPLPATPPP